MKYIVLILRIALIVLFLMAGIGKVIASPDMVANFNNWGWTIWMMYLTGALEIILAFGLVWNLTSRLSAFLLAIMMFVAAGVHILNGENFLMPVILVLVSLVVAKHKRKKSENN